MSEEKPPWLFQKYTFPNIIVGVLVVLFGLAIIVGCFIGMDLEKLTLMVGIFGALSVHFVKKEKS